MARLQISPFLFQGGQSREHHCYASGLGEDAVPVLQQMGAPIGNFLFVVSMLGLHSEAIAKDAMSLVLVRQVMAKMMFRADHRFAVSSVEARLVLLLSVCVAEPLYSFPSQKCS